MASYGRSQTVRIPTAYRDLYVLPTISERLHGRGRSGKAKKPKHVRLHGRPRQADPFHHRGQARGQ